MSPIEENTNNQNNVAVIAAMATNVQAIMTDVKDIKTDIKNFAIFQSRTEERLRHGSDTFVDLRGEQKEQKTKVDKIENRIIVLENRKPPSRGLTYGLIIGGFAFMTLIMTWIGFKITQPASAAASVTVQTPKVKQ